MINQAEAWLVTIVSSCGINKRNSNSYRVCSVEHGSDVMTSKTDFAFFFRSLNQNEIIFQFISGAFRYFSERGGCKPATDGRLKMEGKDEHTQFGKFMRL